MGIITFAGKETNWSAKEIREVPKTAGDTSPVAGSIVERDEFGNTINYTVVGETDDLRIPPNTQCIIIKQTSKSQHIVNIDSNGDSDDLNLLNPVGDYLKLGFSGEKASIEVRRLG